MFHQRADTGKMRDELTCIPFCPSGDGLVIQRGRITNRKEYNTLRKASFRAASKKESLIGDLFFGFSADCGIGNDLQLIQLFRPDADLLLEVLARYPFEILRRDHKRLGVRLWIVDLDRDLQVVLIEPRVSLLHIWLNFNVHGL